MNNYIVAMGIFSVNIMLFTVWLFVGSWDILNYIDYLILVCQSIIPIITIMLLSLFTVKYVKGWVLGILVILFSLAISYILWLAVWAFLHEGIVIIAGYMDLYDEINNSQVYMSSFVSDFSRPIVVYFITLFGIKYIKSRVSREDLNTIS